MLNFKLWLFISMEILFLQVGMFYDKIDKGSCSHVVFCELCPNTEKSNNLSNLVSFSFFFQLEMFFCLPWFVQTFENNLIVWMAWINFCRLYLICTKWNGWMFAVFCLACLLAILFRPLWNLEAGIFFKKVSKKTKSWGS